MSTPVAASDLMSRPVHRLTERASVQDAVELLVRHSISGAPVESEHRGYQGVFSLEDLGRALADRRGKPFIPRSLELREPGPLDALPAFHELRSARVGELMTLGMVTVPPYASFRDVVRSFLESSVHHVFVTREESGELQGVITKGDLLRWLGMRADGKELIRSLDRPS
jgi:CBS domain-containing protein